MRFQYLFARRPIREIAERMGWSYTEIMAAINRWGLLRDDEEDISCTAEITTQVARLYPLPMTERTINYLERLTRQGQQWLLDRLRNGELASEVIERAERDRRFAARLVAAIALQKEARLEVRGGAPSAGTQNARACAAGVATIRLTTGCP